MVRHWLARVAVRETRTPLTEHHHGESVRKEAVGGIKRSRRCTTSQCVSAILLGMRLVVGEQFAVREEPWTVNLPRSLEPSAVVMPWKVATATAPGARSGKVLGAGARACSGTHLPVTDEFQALPSSLQGAIP